MSAFSATLLLAATLSAVPPDRDGAVETIRVDLVQLTLIEQAEVPAEDEGVLRSVFAREGQVVEKGGVLAQIDDSSPRLAKERTAIELQIATEKADNDVRTRLARKSLEVAEAELKRANESRQKYAKSVSETELDRLRLMAERAALEVEQSEFDRKTAELTRQLRENDHQLAVQETERRRITAPIPGVVIQINRRQGEWVQPGETLLRIVRIDRLRAEGFLKSNEIATDPTGRPVTLTANLPGRPAVEFAGTVVFVTPEINPVNGQVRFWAEIENRDLLLHPGLEASLIIKPPVPEADADKDES